MIFVIAFVVGALWGVRTAHKRKGNRMDMAQYAVGYGIVCAVLTLFVFIALDQLA